MPPKQKPKNKTNPKENKKSKGRFFSLHSKKLTAGKPKKTTQQFLDIVGIRDNTVVLRDGTLRAIIMVSSMNFSLKGQEEQNSIIYSYQSLLNALNFPIQFVIQSRELNIESYLKNLEELEAKQTNELLRIQTIEYREYVSELVEWGQIMRKRFYIVVSYALVEAKEESMLSKFRAIVRPAEIVRQKEKDFLRYKSLLDQRVARMDGLLNSIGLKSVRLNTQELIELFYNVYNPFVSRTQPLADVKKLNIV